MKVTAFDRIVGVLNKRKVRFLVAGGLAVNAYGHTRATYDVDLVIQLNADNITKAFEALATLGYRPSVPVTAEQFADVKQRTFWIKHKRMQVLNFQSAKYPQAPVDVFVTEPFNFEREYDSALIGWPTSKTPVRFVTVRTLIKMKLLANRPKDLEDIAYLRTVHRNTSNGSKKH